MKRFDFIVNPISGRKNRNTEVAARIKDYCDREHINYHIHFTEYQGHAHSIAEKLRNNDNQYIIAVGGDGTVNEIGSALIDCKASLGIIPTGSGNGLARHLGISMNSVQAIKIILESQCIKMDAINTSKGISLNVCGLGYEAHIANEFQKSKNRGLKEYTALALRDYFGYEAIDFEIEIDGTILHRKAYQISLANSAQFGNNIQIAPKASLQDGLMDVVIVKDFPKALGLFILPFLLSGQIDKSDFVEIHQAKNVHIKQSDTNFQIDGEAIQNPEKFINAQIINNAISVICNPKSINKI